MYTRDLTLLTDLYELTMMQGYYKNDENKTVVFDVVYRENPYHGGYAIAAGLEQVIDYIKNLTFDKKDIEYLRSLHLFDEDFLEYLSNFRFSGDIYAIPEGTVVFPKEPISTENPEKAEPRWNPDKKNSCSGKILTPENFNVFRGF